MTLVTATGAVVEAGSVLTAWYVTGTCLVYELWVVIAIRVVAPFCVEVNIAMVTVTGEVVAVESVVTVRTATRTCVRDELWMVSANLVVSAFLRRSQHGASDSDRCSCRSRFNCYSLRWDRNFICWWIEGGDCDWGSYHLLPRIQHRPIENDRDEVWFLLRLRNCELFRRSQHRVGHHSGSGHISGHTAPWGVKMGHLLLRSKNPLPNLKFTRNSLWGAFGVFSAKKI